MAQERGETWTDPLPNPRYMAQAPESGEERIFASRDRFGDDSVR